MDQQPISNEVAFRIALASRLFPELLMVDFIRVLQSYLGEGLDEKALSKITVTNLKNALGKTFDSDGEDVGDESSAAEIATLKQAVKILWGETSELEKFPLIEPYVEGDMPSSIRVAIASNHQEKLDGHFGSCLRYLIYQLSVDEIRLIDIRSALEADLSEDKNTVRVQLIKDCHVVYVVAVGGPAAAKVIQGGVYPIKREEGGLAREVLAELQQAIATSPPPWLAKILGISVGDRVKNYKAMV